MLLTLLTLITIYHFDCTLGKAFNSQRNNRDIYPKDLRGMQRAKEMLWSSQANFYTNPLASETRDCSAFEQFSVPNDGPASTIEQLSIPNDGPAHFKQLSVPTTAPQAFSATTATTTVIKTPVPMTMTATMKLILLKLDNHPAKSAANHATPRNLLLFFVQNDPSIMIPSLLLPCNFERPAIMMAKHTSHSLQLIVTFIKPNANIQLSDSEVAQHAQINL